MFYQNVELKVCTRRPVVLSVILIENPHIFTTVKLFLWRGENLHNVVQNLSTRRDQSVFNRYRIGHSRLTHEFLLKGEPPPECIPCNCLLTIKHLLIECVDFNDVRQRFYQVPSLQDLFKTVKPEVILEFLKAAALYRLLWDLTWLLFDFPASDFYESFVFLFVFLSIP